MRLNELDLMIDKLDIRIECLHKQQLDFDYVDGFNLNEEIPYKNDFIDFCDFKKYYEIEGSLDFLKSFRDELSSIKNELIDRYRDDYPDDVHLSEYPEHMVSGYFKGVLQLRDII